MRFIFLILFIVSCSSSKHIQDKFIAGDISSRPDDHFKFSVLQGTTDSTSTILRIVNPKFAKPSFKILTNEDKEIKSFIQKKITRKKHPFEITHLDIKDLKPNQTYKLAITGYDSKYTETRFFKTVDLTQNSYKILIASCASDMYNEIGNMIWPQAFSHNPDLTFLIGDNIYADVYSGMYIGKKIPTTLDHLWQRHIDHAMMLKIYRMKNLKPTFTMWDDHDYGMNDGNNQYKDKKQSLEMYHQFFPTKNNEILTRSYGTGFKLNLKKHQFYFLDDRYFRDPDGVEKGFHYGMKQRNWLKKELKHSQAKLDWLVSGDQFFGGYHKFESFEGNHHFQFQKFKKELKKFDKTYALISGDRHLVEVMQIPELEIGNLTYEYTVSGVHSAMFPGNLGDPKSNPYRVDGFDGESNYAILTISNKEEDYNRVEFKAYSLKGEKINRIDSF